MELYPQKAKLEPRVVFILIIPAVVILFVVLQHFHLLNRAENLQSMAEKMGKSIGAPQGVEQIQGWAERDKKSAEWCGYYRSLYVTEQPWASILAEYRKVFSDRGWIIEPVNPPRRDDPLWIQNVDGGYYISLVLCDFQKHCTNSHASPALLAQALRTHATAYILQVIYKPTNQWSCGA